MPCAIAKQLFQSIHPRVYSRSLLGGEGVTTGEIRRCPSLPRRDAFARPELRTWPAELRFRRASAVKVLVPATRRRSRETRWDR